jgi:exodeoxyribonuclease-3
MKIVSWNVNSIKARRDHVLAYLTSESPDVLMIQELKGVEFPSEIFEEIGYHSVYKSQKAYNGVAILSKTPITLIHDELPGDSSDEQARYLEVDIQSTRMIGIYLPNGNPVDTDKFTYKLGWMERLKTRLQALREDGIDFLIGGDFNIIPEDKDCYDPKAWENDAATRPESRALYRSYENMGLYDAFRMKNKAAGQFTFWDYQAGAWQKDNGIRIDHFLLTPALIDRLQSCAVDKKPRGQEKPSDHTPIYIEIAA